MVGDYQTSYRRLSGESGPSGGVSGTGGRTDDYI